jgi:hypothetical protein
MVFSVQRFIEDYLNRRSINDTDQYAVAVANLYDQSRSSLSQEEFLLRMRRIRTSLFRRNRALDRPGFETTLLRRLDAKFKKKLNPSGQSFPGGLKSEARRFRKSRRSIGKLLAGFKDAVEARAIDGFWNSRRKNRLKAKPEQIAQGLLAVFAKGVLGQNGLVRRELQCGIGYVDVEVQFASTPHLIELKILKGKVLGDAQLSTYMKTENRSEGWLVLIDARKPASKRPLCDTLAVDSGTIHVVYVDINPPVPSGK